jgi:steroid 5-alpha reductase family enzyme
VAPPAGIPSLSLWAWCRHPNYWEILFWWGLFAFSLASGLASWWTAAGAIAITLMFRVVSIPMIERRMRERRPGYAEHAERTSMLLPPGFR